MLKHKLRNHPRPTRKQIYIFIALLITMPLILLLFSPKSPLKSPTPQPFTFPLSGNELAPSPLLSANTAIIDSVSSLMELPTDEEPFIATVTDPSVLQDQSFFQKAQIGDKILVYKNAKLAILYRPTTYKIITTSSEAVIQINQPDTSGSASASTSISAAISKPLQKILK